jgi:hypothetical protein
MSQQRNGSSLTSAAGDRQNAGMKPVPAVSQVDGEFNSFALACGNYAVENFAEWLEDLFAEHVHRMADQISRVGSIPEVLAGTPHTQECAVGIEFEQELGELPYQGCQRPRCSREGRFRPVAGDTGRREIIVDAASAPFGVKF